MSSVSSSRPSSASSSSVAGFGTNEWLVEEMYQQYLADPSSVDQAWHEFFADYRPGSPVGGGDREEPAASANGAAARRSPPRRRPPRRRPPPQKRRRARTGRSRPAPAQGRRERAAPTASPPQAPAAEGRRPRPVAAGKQSPLRGASAAVVKNMNVSLTVPTATSVRAVPAKLLADNRIVINNHLARSRGGKVSFTHLIGYALVRALDDFPNMNNAYAEVDGKPVLVQPEHVNFGLAIDLPEARRLPLAGRGVDQGRRDDGLRRVLGRLRGRHPPGPRRTS